MPAQSPEWRRQRALSALDTLFRDHVCHVRVERARAQKEQTRRGNGNVGKIDNASQARSCLFRETEMEITWYNSEHNGNCKKKNEFFFRLRRFSGATATDLCAYGDSSRRGTRRRRRREELEFSFLPASFGSSRGANQQQQQQHNRIKNSASFFRLQWKQLEAEDFLLLTLMS